MNLKNFIIDVMKDFERINKIQIQQNIILDCILKSGEFDLEHYGAENLYALVMEFMYFLKNRLDELDDIDEKIINRLLTLYLSDGIIIHLERIEIYKWVPEVMEKVWEDGQKLFEMAKNAYFVERNVENTENANIIFDRILLARKSLEKENYKYRNKKDVIDLYEQEVSESQLDMDVIERESIFLSFRLSEYIQSLEILDVEEPDFSCESPFSMPDDMFKNL